MNEDLDRIEAFILDTLRDGPISSWALFVHANTMKLISPDAYRHEISNPLQRLRKAGRIEFNRNNGWRLKP